MFHPSQQKGFVSRIVQELWDFNKIDASDYMKQSSVEILSLDDAWLREMGFWNGESLPSRDEDVRNTNSRQTWTKEEKTYVLNWYEELRREGHGHYSACSILAEDMDRTVGSIGIAMTRMKQADDDDGEK